MIRKNVLVENCITLCSNVLCRKVCTDRDITELPPIVIEDPNAKGKKRLAFYAIDYGEFSNNNYTHKQYNSLKIILSCR